jgi:hypothetical protein
MKRLLFIFLWLSVMLLYGQSWIREYNWWDLYNDDDWTMYPNPNVHNVIPAIGGGYLLQARIEFWLSEDQLFWVLDDFGNVVHSVHTNSGSSYLRTLTSNGVDRYYSLFYNGIVFEYDIELNMLSNYDISSINGITGNRSVNELLCLDDGFLLVIKLDSECHIAKTNMNFEIEWISTGVWTSEPFNSVIPCNEGWMAVGGRSVCYYSSTGDLIWFYSGYDNSKVFYDAFTSQNGQIFVAGYSTDMFGLQLFEVDIDGEQLNPTSDSIFNLGTGKKKVVEMPDGNILAFTYSSNSLDILHCFTLDGAYLWGRSFFTHDNYEFGWGKDFGFIDSTGDVLFCMRSNNNRITLVKVDPLDVSVLDTDQAPLVSLISIYPNPFNRELNLDLKFPENQYQPVLIGCYNLKGQLVRSWTATNSQILTWNGTDSSGNQLSPGVYIIRATSGVYCTVSKILKIR